MGRRKKSRPNRSGGAKPNHVDTAHTTEPEIPEAMENYKSLIVEVDGISSRNSDEENRDIAEVVLTDLKLSKGISSCEEFMRRSDWKLRIKVENLSEFQNRIKLGHWPVLSSESVRLEFVVDLGVGDEVMMSGCFDGPDEGVTGLVHLVSLKFMSLRPVFGAEMMKGALFDKVRVEILKSAFDACESLLDCRRQVWRNSMMNAMAWLRPEVSTSEARYGVDGSTQSGSDLVRNGVSSEVRRRFDASRFYEAIKPSKSVEPLYLSCFCWFSEVVMDW